MKENLNKILDTIREDIDISLLKRVMVFTLVFGFIVHGYNYFNVDYVHDSLAAYNQKADIIAKIGLGRFMQALSVSLRGYDNIHIVNGILSLISIGLSTYIITRTLAIKSRVSIILISAIFITSLNYLGVNLVYSHELDAFMYGLLFASIGVYAYTRFKYGYLAAAVLIAMSCGFYQAYMSVSILLLMLIIIRDILNGSATKYIAISSIKSISTILLGGILYFIMYNSVALLADVEILKESYNSIENVYSQNLNIIELFNSSYWVYIKGFLFNYSGYRDEVCFIINSLILLYMLFMVIQRIRINNVSRWNIFFLFVIILLIPVGGNVAMILNGGYYHTLMGTTFSLIYLLLFILMENEKAIKLKFITYCLLGFVVFSGFIYANKKYVERTIISKINYEIIFDVYKNITINEAYKRDKNIPIRIVGDINNLQLFPAVDVYKKHLRKLSHSSKLIEYVLMKAPISTYIKLYFNTEMNITKVESDLNKQVEIMPSYPNIGSINTVNDTLYVKFPMLPQQVSQ